MVHNEQEIELNNTYCFYIHLEVRTEKSLLTPNYNCNYVYKMKVTKVPYIEEFKYNIMTILHELNDTSTFIQHHIRFYSLLVWDHCFRRGILRSTRRVVSLGEWSLVTV